MTKDWNKWLIELKRKLGHEKFCELAGLWLERKIEGASPEKVVKEFREKFGEIGLSVEDLAIFIKY